MKRPWLWTIITVNLVGLIALAFAYPTAMVSPGVLMPAHAELARDCFACHSPLRGATSDRCVICHAVKDIGVLTTSGAVIQRLTRPVLSASFHQELSEQKCTACHSEHGRLTEHRFSHELLRPAARGACATCHAVPQNELHRELRANCDQCHTTEHWSPATFDHPRLSSSTLAMCEGCHAVPKDTFHQQITSNCAQCHTPQRWKPSTFNHARLFRLDGEHNTTCATCHPSGDLKRYTCFGCHEHTPANIRAEHEEEGIGNIDNCVACHRSGDGEGGEGRERDEH